MSAIFISYSSKDRALATDLHARLRAKNYQSVFLDQDREDGIPPGDKWESVLYQELRSCHLVIALVSDNWSKSQWCFAEATHAREKGKSIVGLRIQPTTDSALLADSQLIDFTPEHRDDGWFRLWSTLDSVLDWRSHLAWDRSRSPYPGLGVFEEQDAPIYFGRDDVIRDLKETLERLRRQRHPTTRFVVVLGASGSGKSSLVRAGLVPLLKQTMDDWLVVGPLIPHERLLDVLAQSLAGKFLDHEVARDWKDIRNTLASARDDQADASLSDLIGDLRMRACKPNAMVLIIVDQLEEIFSRPDPRSDGDTSAAADSSSSELVRAGVSVLRRLTQLSGQPCMILGTLRSDFLGDFQKQTELKEIAYESFQVPSMRESDYVSAIEGPASLHNLSLEPGLTKVIVEDTATNDALPLLAFTLNKMWTMFSRDGRLTIEQYKTGLGSLQGALDKWSEDALPSRPLTAAHERILKAGFLSLVRISEEGQMLRRSARLEDLPRGTRALLEPYVQARLLVSRSERPDGGDAILEVSHETLFRAWARLRTWLTDRESQNFLTWRESFSFQLTLWNRNREDEGTLLQPVQLRSANRWLKTRPELLNESERHFITVSVRTARRGPRRRAAAIAASAVLVAGAVWQFTSLSDWYEFYSLDEGTKAIINREFVSQVQSVMRTGISTLVALEVTKDPHFLRSATELPNAVSALSEMSNLLRTPELSVRAKTDPVKACKESTDRALETARSASEAKETALAGWMTELISNDSDEGNLQDVVDSCTKASSAVPQAGALAAAAERVRVVMRHITAEHAQIDHAAAEMRGRQELQRAVQEKVNVNITYGNGDDFRFSVEQSQKPASAAEGTAQKGLSPEQAGRLIGPASPAAKPAAPTTEEPLRRR